MEVTMIKLKQISTFSVITASCRNTCSTRLVGHSRLVAILLSAIYLLCISTTVLAQTQLGADIDGEAAYDQSSRSVALSFDGNRLVIGADGNDGNGFDSGHVRVYQWSDTNWVQLGADINGEAAYDQSGRSVALSSDGNRLAIGADGNDGNVIDSGHVRVYQWSDTNWVQLGADIDGEAANDQSGWSVSLSSDGNRLAIGAAGNDGNGIDSGHVRIYQWSGTAWAQFGVDIDGEAYGDRSGWSVSLSSDGKRLAVGAYLNISNNGVDSGHVRIYQWSGTAWSQLGADIDGEAAYDQSGWSVSLSYSGSRLVIGADRNDDNGIDSGHVRVYQWSDTNWAQLGADIDGEAAYDQSGRSVALSSDGNRLAIGAAGNDDNGIDSGHVRVSDVSMFNVFKINAGLNDAWYSPATSGQGFFITVFPDLGTVSLAWFTYDTELPADGVQANLGDPGHRWLTALGPIEGNQVMMNIDMTSGGIFDTATDIQHTDPPGSDGTIKLTFDSCNSGTVEYDITSISRQGTVPIRRVADDNIVHCEVLSAD
jgi:hypothetical protein